MGSPCVDTSVASSFPTGTEYISVLTAQWQTITQAFWCQSKQACVETLAQPTWKQKQLGVCIMNQRAVFQGLVTKNTASWSKWKQSLSLFHQSSQSSLETNIQRFALIFPGTAYEKVLHIQLHLVSRAHCQATAWSQGTLLGTRGS